MFKAQSSSVQIVTCGGADMWIRSDYDFGCSYARITIGQRDLVLCGEVRRILERVNKDPDLRLDDSQERLQMLAKELYNLIVFNRPDLEGGQVMGIRKDFDRFVIDYYHHSLPRVFNGSVADEIELHRMGEVYVKEVSSE